MNEQIMMKLLEIQEGYTNTLEGFLVVLIVIIVGSAYYIIQNNKENKN